MQITIVTPSFNSGSTIRNCLESVDQQVVEVEHIIIDGRSTDATLDVVRGYPARKRRLVSEPDQGPYDAMNKGIRMATGEVIGILNADDSYVDNDVLQTVAAVFKDPAVMTCYADLVYVDRNRPDRVTRHWRSGSFSPRKFYHGWMPPHPTFFVRRQLYEWYGGFDLFMGTSADYELMLRFLLRHGASSAYIPKVLVRMRTGGISNASVSGRLQANRMDRLAWRKNDLRPCPWTLAFKPLRKISQFILRP